jgi:hypothetical protein
MVGSETSHVLHLAISGNRQQEVPRRESGQMMKTNGASTRTRLAVVAVAIPFAMVLALPFLIHCVPNGGDGTNACHTLARAFTWLSAWILIHKTLFLHNRRLGQLKRAPNPIVGEALGGMTIGVVFLASWLTDHGVTELAIASVSGVSTITVSMITVPTSRHHRSRHVLEGCWLELSLVGLITWSALVSYLPHFQSHREFLLSLVIGAVAVHTTHYIREIGAGM